MTSTDAQKALFEGMHDRYTEGTTDRYAKAYRDEFMLQFMLEQLGEARSVIEIASGVGQSVGWLREQRPYLDIAGCDISRPATEAFTARHRAPSWEWDLTKPIEPPRTFDAVLVMGGIHHLVADLPTAFANIRRLLNPGGRLLMAEPSADYILEPIRQIWYRLDKRSFDADNEHALSHKRLFREHGAGFDVREVRYLGGPGYFVLLQNWALGYSNRAKGRIAEPLMAIERAYHRLPGPLPFAAFLACWQRR